MRNPVRQTILLLPLALVLGGCGDRDAKAKLPEIAPASSPVLEPQDLERAETERAHANGDGSYSGLLEAKRRSTLSPKVSGVVEKVHVRDGDSVDANAPLVTLDSEDFALRVKQAEAGYDAAKAGFSSAEADWKRAKSLVADSAMPQAQFEMSDARYHGAKAQLAQAEVALAMARKSERDATVRAPYAGVIVRRSISEGEYASMMPPTQLLTIEETGSLDLRVYVPWDIAAALKKAETLDVRVAALDRAFKANIIQIVSPVDPRQGTAAVLVEIVDPDRVLRPGMTAEARFTKHPVLEKKP